MKKVNRTNLDVFISTISEDSLKESMQDNVVVNYADSVTSKNKIANQHVSVPNSEVLEYLSRNGLKSAKIVVHTFPDDYKAICLRSGNDTIVELEKIPEVNKQSKSCGMPTPMDF